VRGAEKSGGVAIVDSSGPEERGNVQLGSFCRRELADADGDTVCNRARP